MSYEYLYVKESADDPEASVSRIKVYEHLPKWCRNLFPKGADVKIDILIDEVRIKVESYPGYDKQEDLRRQRRAEKMASETEQIVRQAERQSTESEDDLELPEALDFLEASGMTVLTADKPEDIDNWPSLDELFPASCPTCEGPSNFLGKLGNREHFRCRNCGMDWSTETEKGGK